MLGPALTKMLHRLASIHDGRTEDQKKVLNELARLHQALPASAGATRTKTQKQIDQALAAATPGNYAGITIPAITTSGGSRTCPCCGFSPVP